jgi:primosomal protein N''
LHKKTDDQELEKFIDKIFSENYSAVCFCFKEKKYTLAELLKRKLQYKIQFIRIFLNEAGILVFRSNGRYHFAENRD